MTVNQEELRILQRAVQHCRPYTLGGLFSFLQADGAIHRCPEDSGLMLASLSAEFSADALCSAGVAHRAEGGALVPAPAFLAPDGIVIALREPESELVAELLTEDGCLSRRELPIFSLMKDGFTRAAAEEDGDLFVVPTLADLAMFRACGIAATIPFGLEDLSPRELAQLCQALRIKQYKSPRRFEDRRGFGPSAQPPPSGIKSEISQEAIASEKSIDDDDHEEFQDSVAWRPSGVKSEISQEAIASEKSIGDDNHEEFQDGIAWRLTFASWSPSQLQLDIPPSFVPIARHFETLERLLGFDVADIYFWSPEAIEIERLQLYVRFRDPSGVRETLLDSAYESAGGQIVELGMEKASLPALSVPEAPQDFAAASRILQAQTLHSAQSQLGVEAHQRAWRDMQTLLETDVIQPMINQALSTPDPVERSLRLTLAEVSRAYHLEASIAHQRLSRALAKSTADRMGGLPQQTIDNLLALADRVKGLSKEIDRCQHDPSAKIIQSRVVGSRKRRGLPNSG